MKSKVVIDAWVSDLAFPGYMDQWKRLAEEFEAAHPEYRVALKGVGFFTGPQEIADGIAAGKGPAIAEYYFYMTQVARDMKGADGRPYYTSVEKAIGGRAEILGEPVVVGDVIPALREYYSYEGELRSMPSIGTTSLLYGNATLLRRAGVERLPRTWQEVRDACAKVAALSGGPEHAITWSNHGTFFQQALASRGGLLADRDNGRSGRAATVDLHSPEMLAWAEWWRGLHRDGHYLHTGRIPDWEGNFRAFAEQGVALRVTSSNDVNYMVAAAESAGFEIETGPFPYDERVPYEGNAVAGTSLWLADGLDDATREGALAFLQFAHSPRNAAERHKTNSFLPLTHAAHGLLEDEGWFERYPHHRVAGDHLAVRTDGRPGTPPSVGAVFGDFAGNQDVMTRAMRDVLQGADPAERFARATEEAQPLLDAYNADALADGPRRPESLRVEHFTDAEPYSGADLENVVRLKG